MAIYLSTYTPSTSNMGKPMEQALSIYEARPIRENI